MPFAYPGRPAEYDVQIERRQDMAIDLICIRHHNRIDRVLASYYGEYACADVITLARSLEPRPDPDRDMPSNYAIMLAVFDDCGIEPEGDPA